MISPVANKLSLDQARCLARHEVRGVTVCLDPDGGGKEGTPSCIKMLGGVGSTAYVAPWLPDGLDPDDFIQNRSIDAWKAHLDGAVHSYRYLARELIAKHRPEGDGPWPDVRADALKDEAARFAAAQPEARRDELARYFWPEVLAITGGTAETPTGPKAAVRSGLLPKGCVPPFTIRWRA